jgi:hypothetical protein
MSWERVLLEVIRIDIDDPSRSTLICHVDVNRDSHSSAQCNPGSDQCSLKIDDDGLAIVLPQLEMEEAFVR